jgi:DNA-directed RNA polymerase subunit beta'
LGIQAFEPVLIEGKAIQLHPRVCTAFNADFDGDQMAVHLPLSDLAQAEARDIMAANKNLLKPADGSPILHIEQDIVLGCYYLTYQRPGTKEDTPKTYSSLEEALLAYDEGGVTLQSRVMVPFRGENRTTTLGRLLFNEVFPEDFPFQNESMTKKRLSSVMTKTYNQYGQEQTALIADELKNLGFYYATISGLSMGMGDFSDIHNLQELIDGGETKAAEISKQYDAGFITDDERYRLTVETWTDTEAKVQDSLSEQFKKEDNTMSIAVDSGARGNISQMMKSVGMLGNFVDTTGRPIELPVRSNYKQGLNPLEYFTATRGTRKALIDIALRTADSGYLTRRLVDVAQDVFTIETEAEDPGFAIFKSDSATIGVTLGSRLQGRYSAETVKPHIKKGQLITKAMADAIDADESIESVKIKSVLSCASVRGVSKESYGVDLATGEVVVGSYPIGVIAAQSIGEPGTQLSLDSKHRSGAMVAAGDDVTQGLARIEELLEVRTPKGQAYLSDISGAVSAWEEGEHYVVQVTADEQKTIKLPLGTRAPRVADGSDVAIGDVVAQNEDGSDSLVSAMAGKVAVNDTHIKITPTAKSLVRYEIPGYKQLQIKDGDHVEAGQRLTNGSINLHELIRLQGVEATQRYIMTEILYIFASQGQNIADKHLEVIVRQMFSRVQIEESGDSEFVTGDIVSKLAVAEANEKLAEKKKQLIKFNQLLLGITKSSLSTDSFLSAASFQDTTRVLISAATSGKVDQLYGLKENVILGRLIPVGTGVIEREDQSEEAVASEVES